MDNNTDRSQQPLTPESLDRALAERQEQLEAGRRARAERAARRQGQP